VEVTKPDPEIGRIRYGKGGEGVKKLLFFGVIFGVGAAVAAQWPEIQRYMKIRNM
jgi:hypothetical protein